MSKVKCKQIHKGIMKLAPQFYLKLLRYLLKTNERQEGHRTLLSGSGF